MPESTTVAGTFSVLSLGVEATGSGGLMSDVRSTDCSGATEKLDSLALLGLTLASSASCANSGAGAVKRTARTKAPNSPVRRYFRRAAKGLTGGDNSTQKPEMQTF